METVTIEVRPSGRVMTLWVAEPSKDVLYYTVTSLSEKEISDIMSAKREDVEKILSGYL